MIEDPPLLTIRRGFARPSPETVARFRGVPTGNLADALGGRAAMRPAIKRSTSITRRPTGAVLCN